jgi:hypothetical protein
VVLPLPSLLDSVRMRHDMGAVSGAGGMPVLGLAASATGAGRGVSVHLVQSTGHHQGRARWGRSNGSAWVFAQMYAEMDALQLLLWPRHLV